MPSQTSTVNNDQRDVFINNNGGNVNVNNSQSSDTESVDTVPGAGKRRHQKKRRVYHLDNYLFAEKHKWTTKR